MGVDILNRQVTLTGCVPSETTVNAINRSSVKRSLFGPVDHQEAMSFFQKEISKMEKEKMNQWNFDFINEKPLKGTYKWQKVTGNSPPQLISKMTFKVTKLKSPRKCIRSLKRSLVNHDSVNNNRRQTTITGELFIVLFYYHCVNNNK